MIRVSVIIPLYNSAGTIERCLRSAMRQSLVDLEILVGDDASTDSGARIVAQLSEEDGRIRLHRFAENRGKPRVMNELAQRARGDFLAVLDADDAYAPDRLERLISAAESHDVEMAADNLVYVDSGVGGEGFGEAVRTAFATGREPRLLGRSDLLSGADTFADFDFGILKPVIRRDFVERNRLAYREESRLAEDFVFLMHCFQKGGRAVLVSDALYFWTMPFGARSRRWTSTGAGAWRYDYRPALALNRKLIEELADAGESEFVRMLERRGRQYEAMIAYIEAQKLAHCGRFASALRAVVVSPVCWTLLLRRVAGRAARFLDSRPAQFGEFAGQRVA